MLESSEGEGGSGLRGSLHKLYRPAEGSHSGSRGFVICIWLCIKDAAVILEKSHVYGPVLQCFD